jgi:hypothetical protein
MDQTRYPNPDYIPGLEPDEDSEGVPSSGNPTLALQDLIGLPVDKVAAVITTLIEQTWNGACPTDEQVQASREAIERIFGVRRATVASKIQAKIGRLREEEHARRTSDTRVKHIIAGNEQALAVVKEVLWGQEA